MAKPPEKRTLPTESQPDPIDTLADEIAKRIGNVVSKDQRAQVVAQVVSLVKEERFSGPIAHPAHLREYEDILPGAADRIISMAESNLKHAQEMQEIALKADVQDMKDGRFYGFIALLSLIVAAFVCGLMKMETLALAFLGAGALGVVSSLIKGRGNGNGASK